LQLLWLKTKAIMRKAVIVEHPQKGIYRLGFTTSEAAEEIQQVDDRKLLNVFMQIARTRPQE